MNNTYYEVVFEGHYKAIYGLLEGFMLGRKKDWVYFFSNNAGIKTETFAEIILEWVTMKTKLHHVIMEEEFYNEFSDAVGKYSESTFVDKKYIKSSKKIKEASFEFETKTYAKKYGNEIKGILKNLPNTLTLHEYNPIETEREDDKGVEMYAPEHSYEFEAGGKISGDIADLIDMRKKLDAHALVEVKKILIKV